LRVPSRPRREDRQQVDPNDAIRCVNLSRNFKTVRALDEINFSVAAGEIFGLLGPNGAGKTTTIRILTGLIPPTSGEAYVFGHDVKRASVDIRRLFGYVPQMLSVDAALTGYENVWLYARLFDVPRRERTTRIDEALGLMGLADVAKRMASTYSGGMLRRLELAQSLVAGPRLLILDEPTTGLDPVARGQVWERLTTLRDQAGITILLTTHYMEEADRLCDRVAMMDVGKIRVAGSPSQLKADLGSEATLEDVFREYTGSTFEGGQNYQDARRGRRNARRLG
jgi:ABC-2 type transport system ATP-binding protein